MVSLIENCPKLELLEMENWILPLLFLLADGLVQEDSVCLVPILTVLNEMIKTRCAKVEPSLPSHPLNWSTLQVTHAVEMSPTIWHILKKTSAKKDIVLQTKTAMLVGSLARGKTSLSKRVKC